MPDPWQPPPFGRDGWGHTGGIPKVSVYLPDDLYCRGRDRELSLGLIRTAVDGAPRKEDDSTARARKDFEIEALMDEVRDELGT